MHEYAYSEKHMGTTTTLSFVVPTETLATQIAQKTFAQIVRYEQRFSRFLSTSELSQLNQKGELVVSDVFFTVLQKSYELYEKTAGAFNPLVQIAHYGYTKDYHMLTSATSVNKVSPTGFDVDFSTVERDPKTNRIKLQPHQQLDFGGILKGYVAHQLACSIVAEYPLCTGVIINLGGDIHTRGYDEHGQPFVFFVFNPVTKTEIPIPLTNMSLATSGSYARTWKTDQGHWYHHLLTGAGVPDATIFGISASIIHPDGATAEAFTKLLLQRGPQAVLTAAGNDPCRYALITARGEVKTNIV